MRKAACLLSLLLLLQLLCCPEVVVLTVNGGAHEVFMWQVYYEGNDESAYRFNLSKNVYGLEVWLYIITVDEYAEHDARIFNDDWIELTLVGNPIVVITPEELYVVESVVGLSKIGYKNDGEKSVGGIHAIYYALPKRSFVSYVNVTLHAVRSSPRLDVSRSFIMEWNPIMDTVQLEVWSKGWYAYNFSGDCKGRASLISFGTPIGDRPASSGLTWCFGKRIRPPSILGWKPDVYVEVGYAGGINIAPEIFAGTGNYRCKINVGIGAGQTLNEAVAFGHQETVYIVEKGDKPELVADEAASGSIDIALEILQKISKSPVLKKAFETLGYVFFVLDLIDIISTLGFDETVAEGRILVFKDVSVDESFTAYFNFYAEIASAGLSGGIVNFWGECPFGHSIFDVVNLPGGGMQIGGILFDYHDPNLPEGNLISIEPDGCVHPLTRLISTRDFRVYSLTDDVNATIVVKRDNIVLDGCGHRLSGGVAVVQARATCRENVTVKSMRIEGGLDGYELYRATGIWTLILESFDRHGVFLNDVSNVEVLNCTITSCQVGVVIEGAKSCMISGNKITNMGSGIGIYLKNGHYCVSTEHNLISENVVSSCEVGIFSDRCWGPNNITRNYLVENVEGVRADGEVETVSYNYVVRCERGIFNVGLTGDKLILGNKILNCSEGISMWGSSVRISRNWVAGCREVGIKSDRCNVSENEVVNCAYGIVGGGIISGNNVVNCTYGISYSYGTITHNNIVNASVGIYLTGEEAFARQNPPTVQSNNITRCHNGTIVEGLNGVVISGNNYVENGFGIYMTAGWNGDHMVSKNNFLMNNVSVLVETDYLRDVIAYVFHNNFVGNGRAHGDPPRCVWDNGYPAGGNYWSDYIGVDEKSGAKQDQLGGDGIGDEPYLVSGKAVDRYPLMEPTNELPLMTFSYTVQGQTVLLVSNSVISGFKHNLENKTLSFQVQGKSGTRGFVNINIPKNIAGGQAEVLFDRKPIPFSKSEDAEGVKINFTYEHSKHLIEIHFKIEEEATPSPTERSSMLIAAAVIITALMIAVLLYYRVKRSKFFAVAHIKFLCS